MKRLALCLIAVIVFGACSSGEKVGSGIDVDKLSDKSKRLGELNLPEEEEGGGFVGEQEDAAAQQRKQQQEAAAAQEQAVQEAQERAAVSFDITASGFDPYVIRVFRGGTVKVTNKDSKARTVTADRGQFDSGELAPGQTWLYTANTTGKFAFHDGTRPFVVGTLEVIAQ